MEDFLIWPPLADWIAWDMRERSGNTKTLLYTIYTCLLRYSSQMVLLEPTVT